MNDLRLLRIYCLDRLTDRLTPRVCDAGMVEQTATHDDGSCVARRYGCTDKTARNFVRTATHDDGSCVVASSTEASPPPTVRAPQPRTLLTLNSWYWSGFR